jgi:hypothetical protein
MWGQPPRLSSERKRVSLLPALHAHRFGCTKQKLASRKFASRGFSRQEAHKASPAGRNPYSQQPIQPEKRAARSTITNQVRTEVSNLRQEKIPLQSTHRTSKSKNKERKAQPVPPVNSEDSYHRNYPVKPLCHLCLRFFERSRKKGRPQRPPSRKLGTGTRYYLPADAPAAAGIMPAIAIPSIRASTFSTLAPVSVQAST